MTKSCCPKLHWLTNILAVGANLNRIERKGILFWVLYEVRSVRSDRFQLIADVNLFVFGAKAPQCVRASSFTRFLDPTQRRTTFGRTPLAEGSARRRDLYLTTHNNNNRYPCPGGIRTHILSKRAAADLRLRPRGRWDRRRCLLLNKISRS